MEIVLQHKHDRNKKRYLKSVHLEKRHASPIFLLYISILRYQFPNGIINEICNLLWFFFTSHFLNNFTNAVINSTKSERSIEIN